MRLPILGDSASFHENFGKYSDKLDITVCNIFKETMLDGQLCYQADVDKFSDLVDKKKMVTEGFVFLLDYNEDRMVNEGLENRADKDLSSFGRKEDKDVMIYADTIGEKQN